MPVRPGTRRVATAALSLLLVSTAVGAPAVARGAPGAGTAAGVTAPGGSVDLAPALDATGMFRGAPGLTGSVDLARWAFASDLASGEPPRFALAARAKAKGARRVRPAAAGDWSAVGPNGTDPSITQPVYALTAKRSSLYVGGQFFNLPTAPSADSLAAWDGTSWSSVGATNNVLGDTVFAIAIDGSDLYVGGTFLNANGIASADRIAKWDGGTSQWVSIGGALNAKVSAIAVHGPNVYVGGDFTDANGIAAADYIARYDGSWHAMGSRAGNGALADHVNALAVSGGTVYAGGLFTNANGDARADYIARWDGAWHAMGSNGADGALSDEVFALLASGRDLYVGGNFQNVAGTATADFVARWRNGAWSGLGSNGGNGALDARVYALAMAGRDLYVGGHFLNAAGLADADRVARWDGSAWSALGSTSAIGNTVNALAVFDGSLYVGGQFLDAAGIAAADHLARYELEPGYAADGRIRKGTSGAFKGDDIRNAGGRHQGVSGRAARGSTIVFQISVQNDSATSPDTFRVAASAGDPAHFTIRYFNGALNITNQVVNGTYVTTSSNPGGDRKIKVKIKVKGSAPVGAAVTRSITITSVSDPTTSDTVKVTGKRS